MRNPLHHARRIRAAGSSPRVAPGGGRTAFVALVLGGCVLGLAVGRAHAVVLTGSLSTAVYAQKTPLTAELMTQADSLARKNDNTRTKLSETVRLDALNLGSAALSFHTSFN